METRSCPVCNTQFTPTRPTSTYCSRPCARTKNGGHNRKPETWWINARGYVEGRVWINGKPKRYKKHRWVMEQHLGRPLTKDEDIHHINGNKQDNRPENLQLLTHGNHATLSNYTRPHKHGYRLKLTDEQRRARSECAKRTGLARLGRQSQGLE